MFGSGSKKQARKRTERQSPAWIKGLLIGALFVPALAWGQSPVVTPPNSHFPAAQRSSGEVALGQSVINGPAEKYTGSWLEHVSDNRIPPHPAGTICVVAQSWCAMELPGPVNSPCACPGLYGRTRGHLE